MPKPLAKITFEITVPLATHRLSEKQLDTAVFQVKRGVKHAMSMARINHRAIGIRTIVDDVTIADSNDLVEEIKENA